MKQNITLSLDKDLLARARVLAAQRSISMSRLLADELSFVVREAECYEQARRQALAVMDQGFRLGGRVPSREELHER